MDQPTPEPIDPQPAATTIPNSPAPAASASLPSAADWNPSLASGRPPLEQGGRRSQRGRWLVGLVGLVGLAVVNLAIIASRSPATSPAEQGYRVGAALGLLAGSLLFALVVWAVVWLGARLVRRRWRFRSPAIAFIAVAVLALDAVGLAAGRASLAGTAAPLTAADLDAAMSIAAPYRLEHPPASEESQMTSILVEAAGSAATKSSVAVRRVYRDQAFVGYAFAVDARVPSDADQAYLGGAELGMASLTPDRTTVAGHPALHARTGGVVMLIWIEPPEMKMVLGLDDATAAGLAKAFAR